jgi:uncharacterized protein YneF (UPF0154 family)
MRRLYLRIAGRSRPRAALAAAVGAIVTVVTAAVLLGLFLGAFVATGIAARAWLDDTPLREQVDRARVLDVAVAASYAGGVAGAIALHARISRSRAIRRSSVRQEEGHR